MVVEKAQDEKVKSGEATIVKRISVSLTPKHGTISFYLPYAIFCFTVKHGKIRAQNNIKQNHARKHQNARYGFALNKKRRFMHHCNPNVLRKHENILTPLPARRVRSESRRRAVRASKPACPRVAGQNGRTCSRRRSSGQACRRNVV